MLSSGDANSAMRRSSCWPQEGARGLTHLRVDRRAGFADGTTSFYYQTRSALLRGAIDRVVSQDVADFTAAMTPPRRRGSGRDLVVALAEHAMRTAVEPERTRARARFELMMIAARPRTERGVRQLADRFVAISEGPWPRCNRGTPPTPRW